MPSSLMPARKTLPNQISDRSIAEYCRLIARGERLRRSPQLSGSRAVGLEGHVSLERALTLHFADQIADQSRTRISTPAFPFELSCRRRPLVALR